MIKLYKEKTYIENNKKIVENMTNLKINPEDALKNTMSYRILEKHNTSGNMKKLKLQFDSMGVYDNTYVGILQTARASGLEKFKIPCVFTNCHNALCAVGGTINADVHKYALSACQKYGGIFVPPHQAVIHQYMREMIVKSGDMAIVSDSHTRYGTQGSLSIGEGGPEIVKQMIGKGYDLDYPEIIAVFLKGIPKSYVGPMDVALNLIKAVFKDGFVKNKVLEFVGPGVSNLSMDFRNGIDTMTTESTCLSSIWTTDEKTKEFFKIHGRVEDYKEMSPGEYALYDGIVEIDLDKIVPSIALPFHPSNVYSIEDVVNNPYDIFSQVENEARKTFENNDVKFNLVNKIVKGKIKVDQGIVAGCAAGSFENIYLMNEIAKNINQGLSDFGLNVYPASQPIMYELNRIGALNSLMEKGTRIKTAFCGPCFGAGDTPANNDFSIRHVTRNFPNREGSNPATGQIASVALMDARSIAATAFKGGVLTSAADYPIDFKAPKYYFNSNIYKNVVYDGYQRPKPETELVYGPDIRDWPEMEALTENLLLKVASVIRDEVTTTDELIPSGETASYRSNPYKISEFTLIRKDPEYVVHAKDVQSYEKARLKGDIEKVGEYYKVLKEIEIDESNESLAKTTGIGSLLYAKRPGDGSAREYAASCQKVLGGLANICIEFATKRYKSNCINWGIIPFTYGDDNIDLKVNDYIYLPQIRKSVETGAEKVECILIREGEIRKLTLKLEGLSQLEREVLLAGSLINYYK
jgi:aconitate hydratase